VLKETVAEAVLDGTPLSLPPLSLTILRMPIASHSTR
jgi:hypothetical protein